MSIRPPRHRRRHPDGDVASIESPLEPTIADYAYNLLAGTPLRRLDVAQLRRLRSVDLVLAMAPGRGPRDDDDGGADTALLRRRLRAHLRRRGGGAPPRPPGEPVAGNLARLGDLLGLGDAERAVLLLALAFKASEPLRELTDLFGALTLDAATAIVAAATARPRDDMYAALAPAGRLVGSGLVTVDEQPYNLSNKLEIKHGLVDAMLTPGLDRAALLARFVPEAGRPGLGWDDLEHVRERAEIARALLAGALRARRPCVNVLVHGPTGTGKTELARRLAADLGASLHVAGRADDEGHTPLAEERLSSLLLGHRLVGGAALLLFDELEDLFTWSPLALLGGKARAEARMSKQWFNALLETNPVPTIWITNELSGIDPAFLRRFAYAIEVPPLGPRGRARVLARHLGDDALAPADVDAIAQRYPVSPAQLGGAVAAARLIAPDGRPDRATLERVLAPVTQVVTGVDPSRRPPFDTSRYRLDALHSPDDLAGIADRLARWQPGGGRGVSLCLYGPPGTGKSEYVKYLAHRMGRPVIHRHASDLLSCWVGGTERALAEAFRQAEDDDAVLVLDEVDSLLRDRRGALHAWEVSQVNELLQQLERFRGVVACTTNLWRDLDEAALRRFVFKIELRYLRPDQAAALFATVFADDLASPLSADDDAAVRGALARVPNLAPGDLAAVARRVRALGDRPTAAALVAMLLAEARAKPAAARAVGF